MPIVSERQALDLLKSGEIVALPTETVYGLAGRIDRDDSLQKIFSAKQRPFFDPLIVHVSDLKQGQEWAEVDEVSALLATHFWPGPLTLVVPKKQNLSSLINNGGPTVALRSPNHPAFQSLLQNLGVPLAAPSANMFGKTSPTEAQHVIDEFADQIPVVDGGLCFRGIESTVIQVLPREKKVLILRPGIISGGEIKDFLSQNALTFEVLSQTSEASPGHLQNHYQPTVPLVLVEDENLDSSGLALLQSLGAKEWFELKLSKQPAQAARNLYSDLRRASKNNEPLWVQVDPDWPNQGEWAGLYDRLSKASIARLLRENSQWKLITKA